MSTIERRFVKGAQVRAKKNDKPAIEGYGSVFNEDYVLYEDSSYRIVERIKPGAFSKVLKEKQDTRCLFNHDANQVLGRTTNNTLRCSQDDTGLHFENDMDARTTVGQNVQAFVDRGDVTGCSFAFTVSKQSWRDEKQGNLIVSSREIEEIDQLYDVGPVTYPAYSGTSVGARSAEMRAQVLAMDGLPAEVRSALERAKKKEKDPECKCRCVACARDKDCEKCVDHMVDCGDEKNCRCKDSRSAAAAGKRDTIGGGKDCQCTCPECQVGDCEHCSDPNCKDDDCNHDGGDHADEDDRSAKLLAIDARMRTAGLKPSRV